MGVQYNKLDNQTILKSFPNISQSTVFTDIKNDFAYASRFRNDMRALFIKLHVLHRSYKSDEKLRVQEQKKKEAADSTNIEVDINDNRNNQISTKIDAVPDPDANIEEKKRKSADDINDNKNNQISTKVVADGTDADDGESLKGVENQLNKEDTDSDSSSNVSIVRRRINLKNFGIRSTNRRIKQKKAADNTNNGDVINDYKNDQISTKVVADADAVAGPTTDSPDLKGEGVIKGTASRENNKTISQSAYSIANNGTDADDGESIKRVENQLNKEDIEQKDTKTNKINNNNAEYGSDSDRSSNDSKLTLSLGLTKYSKIKKQKQQPELSSWELAAWKKKSKLSPSCQVAAFNAAMSSIKTAPRDELVKHNRQAAIDYIKKYGGANPIQLTGATELGGIKHILDMIQRHNISPSEELDIPDLLQFLLNRISPKGETTKMPVEDLKSLIESYGISCIPEDGTEIVSSLPVSSPVRVSKRRKANQPERFRNLG